MTDSAAEAQTGDTVQVHYTGTLADGTEFDSSRGNDPLAFTLGEGQVIPGFESAVLGMQVGETKVVTIPCDQAYGEHHQGMVQAVPRSAMPDDLQLVTGMTLHAQGPDGQVMSVTVAEFDDESVTVDANHPLAGHDLIFDLELVAIG